MTANFLDSISWGGGGSVFSRQLSSVIYHPHDQQDEFIEALRKNCAPQSLIESFGELLKGHQIRSRKDTTSNDLRKPSKHVTRFPLRGLVLEYMGRHWGSKRPGRGQSNASELTIARSDQLRGCCKKGTTSGKRWDSEIFTPAIWRCLVVATSDFLIFLGLGPMSKSPWIHCWRVLCVPFLHCQRGNL